MKLKISMKNSKLGRMPNLSLPPGASCIDDAPCLSTGCYAMKSYRLYPNVTEAWGSNLELYKLSPNQFFDDWHEWLEVNKPQRFRTFVGGDFPSEGFYGDYERLAEEHQRTSFLVFTKRYDYDFSLKPENSEVILSTWPGLELPKNKELPWSWLEEDPRKPDEYFRCVGKCDDCGHTCWDKLSGKIHVVFPKH